jgi:hypothetical protein
MAVRVAARGRCVRRRSSLALALVVCACAVAAPRLARAQATVLARADAKSFAPGERSAQPSNVVSPQPTYASRATGHATNPWARTAAMSVERAQPSNAIQPPPFAAPAIQDSAPVLATMRPVEHAPAASATPPEQASPTPDAPPASTPANVPELERPAIPTAPALPASLKEDPNTSPTPSIAGPANAPATSVLDDDVLARIRREIKQRLPYFQACANTARRRTGIDVRRFVATWDIASDGKVRSLRVDGIQDRALAACLMRVGSWPMGVQPGQDLRIPTPILFVR